MAVDNPSYFSLRGSAAAAAASSSETSAGSELPAAPTAQRGFGGFFRRSKQQQPAAQQQRQATRNPAAAAGARERRSFRSLFRSMSANADCERTRQFLKGEPLPTDIAPPSPCASRSHKCAGGRRYGPKSPSEMFGKEPAFHAALAADGGSSAGSSLSRCLEDEDDYYQFEASSECGSEASTLPLDEPRNQPNYYNLTSTLPSPTSSAQAAARQRQKQRQQSQHQRRHSTGTFMERERCAIAASATAVTGRAQPARSMDLVDEHEPDDFSPVAPTAKHNRFGTRHAGTAFPTKPTDAAAVRDDVVFVSSRDNEASTLWVNYLTACFEQISRQQGKPPFKIVQLTFEEQLGPGMDTRIRSSRLQIVVVCPIFLERVAERPEHATSLTRLLSGERALAMMLGVQDGHLSAAQRASLVTYPTWRKFFVKDQDETFVGQFLGAALAILGSATANNSKIDKTGFSVHPKKVKLGHNRILALLNEPLQPEDMVCVTIDRCGEAMEIGHVKRRNPYTLQFCVPDRCLDVSMLVGVRISRNGTPLGLRQVKCESRLRELDQILRAHDNPLEFMCQTFGFHSGDKDQLDNWMMHAFQKNIPPHFNLLSNPPGELPIARNQSSSEEYPTLLHFAARFGLEKLAWQLLECPGGDVACDMRNVNDHTPADLAEQSNHLKLAHQLRGYMQMNEFSNMYSYLKVMSENANANANGYKVPQNQQHPERHSQPAEDEEAASRQEDYCRPRPLSEAYSVPPVARPVTNAYRNFPDYSTPPPLPQPNPVIASVDSGDSATPTPTATPASLIGAYASTTTLNASSMELPLQGLRSPDSTSSTPTTLCSSQLLGSQNLSFADGSTTEMRNEAAGSSDQSSSRSNRSSQSSRTRECPQDELLEIITDFKNNVFTIAEVERLVDNWRNRNDVQQSFRDKQRQLSDMRDEYERIQKRIKDEMKAPTPFDRIKKFFTKSKKDSKDTASASEENVPSSKQTSVNGNLADRRPVSSLSLHSVSSSSSSGRMSTVSGCSGASLGDSGTHSDTDDRRHQVAEEKSTGMTSYEIPPAPKSFHGKLYQSAQSSAGNKFALSSVRPGASNSELDLRPVKSSHSAVDDKEYYIAFPPSGLPIHSFKSSDTINGKELKTPMTPTEVAGNKFSSNNYANMGRILVPPPGMSMPFQPEQMNIRAEEPTTNSEACKPTTVIKDVIGNLSIHIIQPEIHREQSGTRPLDVPTSPSDDSSTGESTPENDSPKILNVEEQDNQPDYANVQVAASEEIARNFGVTLKKLPVPPSHQRCEFNFAATQACEAAAKSTAE